MSDWAATARRSSLYYEDQEEEADRRAADFRENRLPKYLGYFERVIERNPAGSRHLAGGALSYAELSLFHRGAGFRLSARDAAAVAAPPTSAHAP
jgi:glutathione S-transferase